MKLKRLDQPGLSLLLVLLSLLATQHCKQEADAPEGTGGAIEVQIPAVQGQAAVQAELAVEPGDAQSLFAFMQSLQDKQKLQFTSSGSGELVFIDSLQGIKNQGADGKNWMYAVDGRLANRGVATMQLTGGQRVQWCFVTYAERESCGKDEAHP